MAETDVMDDSLPEEVLLDENAEAEKHSFYMVGGFEVSPNQQLLAWAEDTVGGGRLCLSPAPSLLYLTSRTLGICKPELLIQRTPMIAGEKYTLHVKELATGKRLLKAPIPVSLACLLQHIMTRGGSPILICLFSKLECRTGHCWERGMGQ